MTDGRPISADPLVRVSDDLDGDTRWEAWRAEGAHADARTQRRVNWLASLVLGALCFWLVVEILRAG